MFPHRLRRFEVREADPDDQVPLRQVVVILVDLDTDRSPRRPRRVRQRGRMRRKSRNARAAAPEKRVRREIDSIDRRALEVDDAVRRMLDHVDDDENRPGFT